MVGDPSKPGVYVTMSKWRKGSFSHPHFHSADRYAYVLDGTWWVGTGSKFDPEHLAVGVKAGSFVTELAKGVLWAGASAIYGVRDHPETDVGEILVGGWL